MPHARLMPEISRAVYEYRELTYMLDSAKQVADLHGSAPSGFDFGLVAVEQKIHALGDPGTLMQRDKGNREKVRDLLIELLADAVVLDYEISNQDVFRALYRVAIAMYAADYVPMRVLGATVEGMVKSNKN